MSRAHEFYGSNDVDRVFGGAPQGLVPWAQTGPTRTHRYFNERLVHETLADPERHNVQALDPRILRATQPGLQRAAAQYYFNNEHLKTGRTFADPHSSSNVTPVVFHNVQNDHLNLLSGHHRALASLLRGEQFHALVVSGEPSTHQDAVAYQHEVAQKARAARLAQG